MGGECSQLGKEGWIRDQLVVIGNRFGFGNDLCEG